MGSLGHDSSWYAVVCAHKPHDALEDTYRAEPFGSAWETADSFILRLGYEIKTQELAMALIFSWSKTLLGKMFWSAQ